MPGTAPCRVLVVDDDPQVIRAFGAVLRGEGYSVVTTAAEEAGIDAFQLAIASHQPFSVVITDLDLGLGHLGGRRVAAAIKDASPSTPVILLADWAEWLETKGSRSWLVDCVLPKPPNFHELSDALSQCVHAGRH